MDTTIVMIKEFLELNRKNQNELTQEIAEWRKKKIDKGAKFTQSDLSRLLQTPEEGDEYYSGFFNPDGKLKKPDENEKLLALQQFFLEEYKLPIYKEEAYPTPMLLVSKSSDIPLLDDRMNYSRLELILKNAVHIEKLHYLVLYRNEIPILGYNLFMPFGFTEEYKENLEAASIQAIRVLNLCTNENSELLTNEEKEKKEHCMQSPISTNLQSPLIKLFFHLRDGGLFLFDITVGTRFRKIFLIGITPLQKYLSKCDDTMKKVVNDIRGLIGSGRIPF